MVTYEEENKEFFKFFLDNILLRGLKERVPNWDRVELMLDTRCNLQCKYCYYHNKKQEHLLYPVRVKQDDYVENARVILTWLHDMGITPRGIDIFGGEVTLKPEFYKIIELIDEIWGEDARKIDVIIPSNYSFILSKKLRERMIDLITNSRVKIILSASIDGKYLESINRPLVGHPKNDPRDDKFYDMVFEFNKKYGYGFHPMVYSNGIELWPKNFLWFQEMFEKFDIPWWNIYLLEVRNPEWTPEQIKKFGEFMEFLVEWVWNKVGHDTDAYIDFLFKKRGFNILNPFSSIGRGLGCSIQSMMYIRLGDLALVPCHRTGYQQFVYGWLVKDGDKIVDVKPGNIELLSTVYSLDAKQFPYCETCPIKEVCSHGCLGAQYEFTGDLFTPIPSVCTLEHMKIYSIVKAMKKFDLFEAVLGVLTSEQRKIWRRIESLWW